MDKFIAQGSGFPGDNEFLMLIQSMINDTAKLSAIGGDNYILSGCEVVGANANAGFMVLNGELVRFNGGVITAQVTVNEAVENATYLEDINPTDGQGDSKATYFIRTAVFGSGGVYTINWADLSRVRPLIEAQKALTPVGGIIMYAGSIGNIAPGWFLCDGTNGTPNLRGKFIVGYDATDVDYNPVGKQGGEERVTLTEAQMPAHKHTGSTNSAGAHSHSYQRGKVVRGYRTAADDYPLGGNANAVTGSAGAHSHTFTTNNRGSSQSHENRPPYYVLAYIQYKGV